jgi:hypothetical protein
MVASWNPNGLSGVPLAMSGAWAGVLNIGVSTLDNVERIAD